MTDNRTLKCLVVDDEPLAAALIKGYVERTPFLELTGVAYSAEEASGFLSGNNIDLIFSDIRMPGLSGMEFAAMIPGGTRIIFTTAYDNYALEGYRVQALDYLLKPVSYNEFLQAALRALPSRTNEATAAPARLSDCLTVKSEYRLVRIPFDDIIYIEGLKDYVKIVIQSSDKAVLTLMSMKSLEDTLPEATFVRVHRSFIVNLDKVRVIERNTVTLAGKVIPISDSYKKRFFSMLGIDE